MSPSQKALIEERISMERPNRTLFIRNIDVRAISHTFVDSEKPKNMELTNIIYGVVLSIWLYKEVWH